MARAVAAARRNSPVLIALIVVGSFLVWNLFYAPASATHRPADKVAAAGSGVEVMRKLAGPASGQGSDTVRLLSTTFRVSSPTDLIMSVTAECALWTNLSNLGDGDSESTARVEVWLTIDGTVVPVAPGENGNPDAFDPDEQGSEGRVVFCNRAQRMRTENFTADGETNNVIRLYNRTRTANGFNWIAVDTSDNYDNVGLNGKNILTVEVWARLAARLVTDDATAVAPPENPAAMAAVGKRTLVIEPVKLPNDFSVQPGASPTPSGTISPTATPTLSSPTPIPT